MLRTITGEVLCAQIFLCPAFLSGLALNQVPPGRRAVWIGTCWVSTFWGTAFWDCIHWCCIRWHFRLFPLGTSSVLFFCLEPRRMFVVNHHSYWIAVDQRFPKTSYNSCKDKLKTVRKHTPARIIQNLFFPCRVICFCGEQKKTWWILTWLLIQFGFTKKIISFFTLVLQSGPQENRWMLRHANSSFKLE